MTAAGLPFRRWRLAAGLALAIGSTAPAVADVRMVFVGIDNYRFTAGKPGNRDPAFKDLGGSVNDMALLKSVLAARWRLPVDTTSAGDPCPAAPAVSMTLLDACATRAGIIGALAAQIAAARPGDTLLFAYSGHGSQALDRSGSQAGGLNGTIVPHDGRNGTVNDILDVELRQMIEAALARGISFVTIADSCNSGSITRDLGDGQPRLAMRDMAPPPYVADVRAAVAALPPPAAAARGVAAYEAALSAASDSQVARERGTAPRQGVFTAALAAAIAELPTPSYADLFAEVQRRLRDANEAQTPGLQGSPGAERTPFLNGQAASARLFAVEPGGEPGMAALAGGTLSGVTAGSSFAVYAGSGAPADGATPLALGVVDTVRAGDASLRLATPIAAAGPLVAVEREHAYAGPTIAIAVTGGTPAQQARLRALVAARPALVSPAARVSHILAIEGERAQLYRATDRAGRSRPIGGGFAIASGGFASGEAEADADALLRSLARFAAVQSLRNDLGKRWGAINVMRACPGREPLPLAVDTPTGLPVAHAGDRLSIGYRNASGQPMHARMLALDPATLEVNPLYRITNAVLENGDGLRLETDPISGDGRQQLLLLLSSAPVDIDPLGQAAARAVGAKSPLQRVLDAALGADAAASRAIVRVNDYSVTSAELLIDPAPRKDQDLCQPAS